MSLATVHLLFLSSTIYCVFAALDLSQLRQKPFLWSRDRLPTRRPSGPVLQPADPRLSALPSGPVLQPADPRLSALPSRPVLQPADPRLSALPSRPVLQPADPRLSALPSRPVLPRGLLDSVYKYRPDLINRLTGQPPTPMSPPPTVPYPNCTGPAPACLGGKYRTADGTCNNALHTTWGSTGLPQIRMLPAAYFSDGDVPRIRGKGGVSPLPSARSVSQVLHTADSVNTESRDLSHLFTMWGQFLDHDVTHTPVSREVDGSKLDCCNQPFMYPKRDFYWIPSDRRPGPLHANPNCFPIKMDSSRDRFFKTNCMNFVRSKAFAPSRLCQSATREQGNTQTAYIDASQVYGASLGDQHHLRTGRGGQLKSARHDLLPENGTTMCTKRPNTNDFCFGSGDPRVNEHPMLSSVHIVFHRYHNQLTSQLALLNPHWDDETLFQEARKIVGAIMQHVTYAEYLPLVVGEEMDRHGLTLGGATSYHYDSYTNPTIINAFSTAAFRFGHSMINGLNSYGFQKLHLRNMFFHPNLVQHELGAGLTMVLNGLLRDHSQSCDRFMNNDLTDRLFQTKGGRSLDLGSLNIQRGRDHGLPSFNEHRKECGLSSLQEAVLAGQFTDVPFQDVYDDLDDVDLFSGGLSERPVKGGVVGPCFACIIGRQFHNLKYGDRFWYQNIQHEGAFTADQIMAIEKMGLSDVMCEATSLTAVQVQPFIEPSAGNPVKECSSRQPMDLSAWREVV